MKKVKTRKLIKHIKKYGCVFDHEGGNHTIFHNPKTGIDASILRHKEIKQATADAICRRLSVPLYS